MGAEELIQRLKVVVGWQCCLWFVGHVQYSYFSWSTVPSARCAIPPRFLPASRAPPGGGPRGSPSPAEPTPPFPAAPRNPPGSPGDCTLSPDERWWRPGLHASV